MSYGENPWTEDLSTTHRLVSPHTPGLLNTAARSLSWGRYHTLCSRDSCKVLTRWIIWLHNFMKYWTVTKNVHICLPRTNLRQHQSRNCQSCRSQEVQDPTAGARGHLFLYFLSWKQTLLLLLLKQACSLSRSLVALANLELAEILDNSYQWALSLAQTLTTKAILQVLSVIETGLVRLWLRWRMSQTCLYRLALKNIAYKKIYISSKIL